MKCKNVEIIVGAFLFKCLFLYNCKCLVLYCIWSQRDGTTDVKRYEVKGDTVVIYFDQIAANHGTCVSLILQPAFEVNEAKDSPIKVYDYYQPEQSRSISYHLPSSKDLQTLQ